MNGLEKITARILAEARAEVDAVRAEAASRCEQIRAEYAKKAEEAYREGLRAGTAETEQRVGRLDRNEKLESRKNILAMKQSLLSDAFARAKEKILSFPDEAYTRFLARQAGHASLRGEEAVILNAKDRERVGEAVVAAANAILRERGLPGGLTLSGETRPISGGLILKQGSIEVNCTVDTLLDLSHNALDAEVAGILFD